MPPDPAVAGPSVALDGIGGRRAARSKRSGPPFWRRINSWSGAWAGIAIAGATLVPIAVWGWLSFENQAQTLNAAQADQRRIAEALGQQTLGLFETQMRILDLVDREAGERDCAALRADTNLRDFFAVAMRRAAPSEAVWVIDSDGYICDSSNPGFVDRKSRSFRDYFIGARDAGFTHYYIGRAIIGLIDSRPIFSMSKPRFKNGTFNGIVLVSVDIDVLTQNWRDTLRPIATQRMAVYRKDGAVIARSWQPFAPAPDADVERRVAAMWQTSPQGGTTGVAPIDQQRRVAAWHSLPDWGVAVTSRVDEAEVLRPWRQSMLIHGIVATLSSVLLGGLVWWLLRGQQMLARTVEERTRALRTLTDAMPQMVWSTRPDGYHDYYNQRWYECTGMTPEQVIGDGLRPVCHPDDRERAWTRWRHSVATGDPFETEYRVRMADGSYRWNLGRALPVRDPETGLITRWFGTCTDIEDTVAAREALARSRDDMERLVVERSRDLATTQARLAQAQRMEALGQLAGGIAHDFNNVLQSVQGGGALIERRPGDVEGVRRLARLILDAADRGAGVTRRLLAFSRRGDLRAEPVDAADLLADTKEILAHTLGAGVEIRVDAAAGLPPLLADKSQLETVLVNLATNARDAMAGIGTLSLTACAETLANDAGPQHPVNLKPGDYLRLAVSDTGSGMDAETLARAAEPFFTTKTTGKGTGLGLAMARGFAEQSGGGLHIESAPGRGTTVRLWFPVAQGAPTVAASQDEAAIGSLGKPRARLLVVDDDDNVREIITEEMEAAGYAVLSAGSAAAALALLDAGTAVDLIVSDLSMPGMDGMALIQETQWRSPGLPAILLTGFATNDAAEIAVGGAISGTFSLLRKPIDGAHLAERVAVLLAAGDSRTNPERDARGSGSP